MFGFLTPVRSEASYPLTDVAAVRAFWQALPRDNAIAAQEALCKALGEAVPRGIRSDNRLQALLQLDQLSRTLNDRLLTSQDAANLQERSKAMRYWQAAFELCRSFGRAYGQLVRSIRDNGEFEDRRDYQSLVLLRFFRQRQLELLLRPFTDDRAPAFSWKEIHDAYTLAQSRWLHREALPIKRDESHGAMEARLEREYVSVLIQDLMNGGQFPPYEASWVNRHLPSWCFALTLKRDEDRAGTSRFVVDPASDAGLVRSSDPVDGSLCLDMTPLLKSLSAQSASLRGAQEAQGEKPEMRRGRQLKVLQRVSALCSAERPTAVRRAERRPTALKVEVVVGLPQILRRVRDRQEGQAVASAPSNRRDSDGMTISDFGPATDEAPGAYLDGNTVTQSPPGTASQALLTMVDESDSGCRLHGAALANNPTIPGALIAFREDAASPWRLAVVRNVKKRLAGRRIEIGAEYLGKDPRWVVVVVQSNPASGKPAPKEPPRFAGLYLSESVTQPKLPMKTLVLPECGLAHDARLSVRSRKSVYTVRLKEPLEEQADFIWSPFEILDRWMKSEAESSGAAALSP